jgi:Nucleotidyltransferase domain
VLRQAAGDEAFALTVAARAARVPGVLGVTLGGSRALGEHRPDSDWDFGLYYRGRLNEQDVRDLDDVEHWLAEAEQGRFAIERLLFHLAGVPTYLVAAELGLSRVLAGELPRPGYPAALRAAAPLRWRQEAGLTLEYARAAYASRGDALGCAGLLAQAVVQEAHARVAARGEWTLNDKRLVRQAGLDHLAHRFARLGGDATELVAAVDEVAAALLGAGEGRG